MPKLPETKKDWEKIKNQFIKMGVEETPEAMTFILSQLQNTKMPELSFEYSFVFNHYKRWKIAKVLQDEKTVYIQALQDKLETMMKEMSQGGESGSSPSEHTEHVSDGTHHFEGDMPPLPALEEGMVSEP